MNEYITHMMHEKGFMIRNDRLNGKWQYRIKKISEFWYGQYDTQNDAIAHLLDTLLKMCDPVSAAIVLAEAQELNELFIQVHALDIIMASGGIEERALLKEEVDTLYREIGHRLNK